MKAVAIVIALVSIVAFTACGGGTSAGLSGDAASASSVKTHAPPDTVAKATSKAHGSLSTGKKHHPG